MSDRFSGDTVEELSLVVARAIAVRAPADEIAAGLAELVRTTVAEAMNEGRSPTADAPVGEPYDAPAIEPSLWQAVKSVACSRGCRDGSRCGTCFGCRRTVSLWAEADE